MFSDKKMKAVYDYLQENPSATVDEIADRCSLDGEDVAHILDEVAVEGDSYVHYGPGQGGGWLPEEVRLKVAQQTPLESVHVGYRWPDGQLHSEPFQPPVEPE